MAGTQQATVFNHTVGLETLLKPNGTRSTAVDEDLDEQAMFKYQPPMKRQRIEKLRSVVIDDRLKHDAGKKVQATMPELFK